MKAFISIVIISLLVAATSWADTRTRAITITTDAFDDGNYAIDVIRNSTGALTQMIYQTPDTSNGILTPAQLAQGPQVIYSKQGHDALLLNTESDFNVATGGHLVLRYVTNAMSDEYKDFRVLIDVQKDVVLRSDPNSNDPDSDNNAYTSVFDQLFLKKNTVFGITVGISQIIPSEK